MRVLVLDVETQTHNKGHPFDPRNELISYATYSSGTKLFRRFDDPDFLGCLREQIRNCTILIGFNIKFDLHWLANIGVVLPDHIKIWDCQFAEFIYSGQTKVFPSLDETLAEYNLPLKAKSVVHDYWEAGVQTKDIPRAILEEYNVGDIDVTYMLYEVQQQLLSDKQKALVFLEGEDMRTLMAAERAGIKFDVQGAREEIFKIQTDVNEIELQLSKGLPAGVPNGCWNWDSGDHLSVFLYGGTLEFRYVAGQTVFKTGEKAGQPKNIWGKAIVEFPKIFKTLPDTELKKTSGDVNAKTRYYSTDQSILGQLKGSKGRLEVLNAVTSRSKKIKVAEMLQSILSLFETKQWEHNLMHPQYNQVVAVTGRLSSSQPNGQNTPPEVDAFMISRYHD